MKRTILVLLVSVFVFQMNAQINEPGKLYIIPKVGYNMANITLLEKIGADPRHAINAGISLQYAINEMISIEPGFFYSMQGSTFKIKSVKLCLNSDYIAIPVLVKTYVAGGFNIFAGPQFSSLTSSKIKLKTGNTLIDVITGIISNNIDLTKYENKLDIAFVFGAGYQFANGLNISANYNIGLSNVTKFGDLKIGDESFSLNPDAKNMTLQVNLGYRF